MEKLLFFPFNGNCKEAVSVVEDINAIEPTWELLGFVDDSPEKKGMRYGKYEVLGNRSIFQEISSTRILAAPGRPDNYRERKKIISSLGIEPGRFVTLIHPSAQIGHQCNLGSNCLIMQNVVLTANVSLQSHVIILPNTVISHDTQIQEFTMIGSNVSVSGGVTIGENCYIGTGAKIIQEVNIGDRSMIGIGSVVLKNVQHSSVYAGNPARDIHED